MILFDIQHNSVVDGPGIRTAVFFKGCNLRCQWCHNPESQLKEAQILFYKDKCTGCGRCRNITVKDFDFICVNDAKKICGRSYTVSEVYNEVDKDKLFYETSGGGVTFSGGECMLQIDFLYEILKKCKENNIHTAVDTAGNVRWEYFEKILTYADLFLYDIKLFDSEKHKKYTGVTNELILSNLKRLFEFGADIWIRIPVISGVNDGVDEMRKIKDFLKPYKPLKIELLPFNRMGENKYTALKMEKKSFVAPNKEKMTKLNQMFEEIYLEN